MYEIAKNLFSLLILGIATVFFLLKKVLKVVFLPVYLIWRNYKKRQKEKILTKHRTSELLIITFSDVKNRLESEKI